MAQDTNPFKYILSYTLYKMNHYVKCLMKAILSVIMAQIHEVFYSNVTI